MNRFEVIEEFNKTIENLDKMSPEEIELAYTDMAVECYSSLAAFDSFSLYVSEKIGTQACAELLTKAAVRAGKLRNEELLGEERETAEPDEETKDKLNSIFGKASPFRK